VGTLFFLFSTCHAIKACLELSRLVLSRNNLIEGKQKLLRVSGRFELHYSKCMKEIQGKSTLVQVSARFELARVRVIGNQL